MAWIESHQELRDHPKTVRLARLLSISRAAAVGHLHFLWWWATTYAPDGALAGFEDAEIELAAGWEGEPGALRPALVSSGFLDEDGSIHDWHDYAGRLVDRRAANRDRMRRARAEQATQETDARAQHVRNTCASCAGLPDLTGPDTTEQDRGTPPQSPPVEQATELPAAVAAASETIRAVKKPSRAAEIVDRIRAAGVPVDLSGRDSSAIKQSSASPDLIAQAFIAAFNGEWEPPGYGFGDGLALHFVIDRLAGYQFWKKQGKPNGQRTKPRFSTNHL